MQEDEPADVRLRRMEVGIKNIRTRRDNLVGSSQSLGSPLVASQNADLLTWVLIELGEERP